MSEHWHCDETDEEAWLLGQPPLTDYLDFVRHDAVPLVDGRPDNLPAFVDEWRAAGERYQTLEESEAGLANEVERRELDPTLAPLVEELRADRRFRRTFRWLPTTFALVQLDRLIVAQKSVTWSFVEQLAARISPSPSAEEVFRFCHPLQGEQAPIEVRRVGARRFVFRSRSRDLRFLDPVLLGPGEAGEAATPGASVAGVAVGYGTNFLNLVQVGRRLLLHNGNHRACALRLRGITHAPAIIQMASTVDELEVIANGSVAQQADLYFRSARPPLLKDYFDPRLRKLLRARRQLRQIEVLIDVKDHLVEA